MNLDGAIGLTLKALFWSQYVPPLYIHMCARYSMQVFLITLENHLIIWTTIYNGKFSLPPSSLSYFLPTSLAPSQRVYLNSVGAVYFIVQRIFSQTRDDAFRVTDLVPVVRVN